jgi:hypothetical protein
MPEDTAVTIRPRDVVVRYCQDEDHPRGHTWTVEVRGRCVADVDTRAQAYACRREILARGA